MSADLDDDADTITIETDRFSTYAVVVRTQPANSGKDDEPKPCDDRRVYLPSPVFYSSCILQIAGGE